MKTIFILQHSYEINGCDETKFIGVYSTKEQAELATNRLIKMPGFRDKPEAFHIGEYEINKDHWTEGYSTMTTIQVKDKNGNWTTVQADCLPNNTYQIIELYDNESLGEFKHLDVVECEKKDDDLFAIKLVSRKS